MLLKRVTFLFGLICACAGSFPERMAVLGEMDGSLASDIALFTAIRNSLPERLSGRQEQLRKFSRECTQQRSVLLYAKNSLVRTRGSAQQLVNSGVLLDKANQIRDGFRVYLRDPAVFRDLGSVLQDTELSTRLRDFIGDPIEDPQEQIVAGIATAEPVNPIQPATIEVVVRDEPDEANLKDPDDQGSTGSWELEAFDEFDYDIVPTGDKEMVGVHV